MRIYEILYTMPNSIEALNKYQRPCGITLRSKRKKIFCGKDDRKNWIVYTKMCYNIRANTQIKPMNRTRIIPDGCDIAIYNHRGEMLIEYNDVPREVAANALNTLQQLILNEDHRRRVKDEVEDKEKFDRLDELFDIRARKLLPKPIRKEVKR